MNLELVGKILILVVFKSILKIEFLICLDIFDQCGADYVKINQTVPIGTPATEPYTRCVSIDGDADRIVYFFTDENNQFYLLDGDRIATLYAG